MIISRSWAMPSHKTFSIKPIAELISRYVSDYKCVADPFCNGRRVTQKALTNDLDPSVDADSHVDALEFLKFIVTGSVDVILFDPPYSARQVSECYKKMDMTVDMQTTQSSYWGNLKKEIARIVRPGGHCITFGWNSGGIGKSNGFEIEEILMVAHGGWHNDTICTVDQRHKQLF